MVLLLMKQIFQKKEKIQLIKRLNLRAKAVTQKIGKEEFARVLLTINKKRGYKSSRKAKNDDEGQLIDGMEVAMKLHDENLTPGQYCLELLQNEKKSFTRFLSLRFTK
jgi:CRISPR-associated endonuclease Csn1